ncbi:hypothetical protein M7784_12585 [Desulfovibrio aminophilus]|nr:hypothetical protein [Desulfovibrio aminophilus]MCM0756076.1 hypothetical protein [Desulfovibrio aminophilus]
MRPASVCLCLLLLLCAAVPARAAQPNPAQSARPGAVQSAFVVILDATAGYARLEAAKPVLNAVVRDLPENAQAALYLYPQPSQVACLPVRELVPLGPLNKLDFMRAVSSLATPDGKPAPVLDLEAATKRILSVRSPVTAVFLSTGLDTCGEDPGPVVSLLKALGLPFTLRIVGYQVTSGQAAVLDNMAGLSGGTYESASNGADLARALRRAFRVENLLVRATRLGAPLDAVIEVRPAQAAPGTAPLATGRTGPSGLGGLFLPVGRYEVTVMDPSAPGRIRAVFQDVAVTVERIAVREAAFGGAEIRVAATKNGKPLDALVEIAAEGGSGVRIQGQSGSPPAPFLVPPGIYSIRATDPQNPRRPPSVLPSVAVRSGVTTTVPVSFDEGWISVRALVDGLPGNVLVEVYSPGEKEPLATGMSGAENPVAFPVLPGVYDVKIIDLPTKKSATRRNVSVMPGQTTVLSDFIAPSRGK